MKQNNSLDGAFQIKFYTNNHCIFVSHSFSTPSSWPTTKTGTTSYSSPLPWASSSQTPSRVYLAAAAVAVAAAVHRARVQRPPRHNPTPTTRRWPSALSAPPMHQTAARSLRLTTTCMGTTLTQTAPPLPPLTGGRPFRCLTGRLRLRRLRRHHPRRHHHPPAARRPALRLSSAKYRPSAPPCPCGAP